MSTQPLLQQSAIYTDRTRIIAYQECPRRRYYHSHFPTQNGNIGIAPVKLYIPFATGSFTHHGLALLLSGMDVDEAVQQSIQSYREAVAKKGIQLELGESESSVAEEQIALVEGMLRAYAIIKLPEILNEYEVMEVEFEDVWDFAKVDVTGTDAAGEFIDPARQTIRLMARADALLREKNSGDLYIQSFKTAAHYDRRAASEAEHDVQGLSEAAATEIRLVKWWQHFHNGNDSEDLLGCNILMEDYLKRCDAPPRIAGIRMEYLLKGRRMEYPEDSGIYVQYSPLIRGYMKEGITGPEFGWKREWKDDSGAKRRLDYRTWKAFNAWEQPGGVKAWIDLLATGSVQPDAGECLPAQFVTPIPYMRQEDDLRDWYEQTVVQETGIARGLMFVEDARKEGQAAFRSALNTFFPQHRRSCDWPTKCAFVDICYGTNVKQDPIASGLYAPREPHHRPELELVQISK
jgi:hypothetical protein